MNEWLNQWQQRWAGMPEREQRALAVLLVVVPLFLFYEVVFMPALHWKQQLHQRLQATEKLSAFLQQHEQDLQRASQFEHMAAQPLPALMQQAAMMTGMPAPSSMAQTGSQVQVQFATVAFNTLAAYLDQLEQRGVTLETLDLAAIPSQAGKVHAALVLAARQSG